MTATRERARQWMRVTVAAASIIWAGGGGMTVGGQQLVAGPSSDGVWQGVSQPSVAADAARRDIQGPSVIVRLDKAIFDAIARRAPLEGTERDAAVDVVLTLPMPDGRYGRFRVQESPMLAPELAAAFPEFATWRGQGLDDPTATTRFGWTAAGFHAIILSAAGTVYIDPLTRGNLDEYVSFFKLDAPRQGAGFICLVGDADLGVQNRLAGTFPLTNGDTKRTYRLALAATGEYTIAAGGTKALALSRMTTTMNRVNGIYERELSVRLTMATGSATDPTALIYTDGATDPYTNTNGKTMLNENQANIDLVVGSANYDIGHVFSTGGGGVASLQSTCASTTKARGVTGSSNPTGDAFDVDYVAHEMGHQFGGSHSFNGTSLNCGSSNRSAAHAYEVGSGSTIMAYAGICSPEDLQPHSNDQFHVESLNEVTAFLTVGGGATCGTTAPTGDTLPTLTSGTSYTIPQQTPFALTATGADLNGDAVTYQWDEFDLGTASSSVATASTDDGSIPLFRSYTPSANPVRTFPSLTYILNNANVPPSTYACSLGTCLTGETLPSTNRTMNFHVTARDNRSGGGAVVTSLVHVTSTTAAGPFAVTSPNTAVVWAGGSTQTVTWNVAATTAAPVSTANVKISLSTDGGTTFPMVLAASTANSGSAVVTIPTIATTTARIKVEAVGNIFFDISNANFSITATSAAPAVILNPSSLALAPGAFASFSAAATGSPAPSVQWQLSTTSGFTWSDIAGATSSTYSLTVGTADNGKRYRAVFANSGGSAASSSATLTISGAVIASPSALNFGAVKALGSATLSFQSSAQTVTITFSGASGSWAATTPQPWISITGGTGSAAGTFTVAIQNPLDVIGASTSLSGTVVLTAATAPNSPLLIPVTLTVSRPGASAPPFGVFDTPANGSTGLQGSFAVTGWALDDVLVDHVELWRDPVAGETTPVYGGPGLGTGKIFIATPLFITGSRGDVEAAYPNYPFANRSGWGYLLLSWGLWNQGNGSYKLYAFAFDAEGNSSVLGTTTVSVSNASATKPFGAIDTPSYGGLVSGSFWNYGWALTPNATPTCTITNGHVQMGIDSLPVVNVDYGALRTDIASAFQGFSNGTNSGGAFFINTTTLTNGTHQIGWLVFDDCGRGDGIGSRFFNVLNVGVDAINPAPRPGPAWVSPSTQPRSSSASAEPVSVRQLGGTWQTVDRNAAGTRVVEVAQDGRVEVQLPRLARATYAGYQDVGGSRRPLPIGSSLDAASSIFYWQPAPGFLGRYDLVFGPAAGRGELVRVRVVVGPTMRTAIDTPTTDAGVDGSFTVAGWTLDLAARDATGVDAVHVWAYPAEGGAPVWLGVAAYGDDRPDVGAVFGSSASRSGYSLEVTQLPPGTYDVVVYPHRIKTNTFDGAQVVRVTVR